MTNDQLAALYERRGPQFQAREMDVQPAPASEAADEGPLPVALTSDAPVRRYDYWRDVEYDEVLSMDPADVDMSYAADGMPFLLDHDTSLQIGKVVNVRLDGNVLRGDVLQGNHPDAAWAFADIRAGIRTKVSVGYLQGAYTVIGTAPDGAEVRQYQWKVLEGTSCPIPADYQVGFGRSHFRALRDSLTQSPERARKGKEGNMAGNDTSASELEAALATLRADEERRDNLARFADANGVDASVLLKWQGDKGFTLASARDYVRQEMTKSIGNVVTSPAEIVVKSGAGPIGRDGQVKQGADGGFDSVGHFLDAVRKADTGRGIDPRLQVRGVATGQSEGVSSDGGFLLPPQYLQEITDPIYKTGAVLSRVRRMTISSNTLNVAMIDETSRATGSRFGAVTANWADEADSPTATGKVKYRNHLFNTKKIVAKGYVTEEQLEDIPSITSTLPVAFREELQFLCEDGIINGNGNGQPAGILNHAALVKQAIEGSQTIANTAASIAANVSKMYSRLAPSLQSGAVWLMNIDLYPKLITATLGGTSAAMPIFLPPGGLSGSPYGTILGLPVIFTEYNAAEGTPGDILLVNLGQYMLVEKATGINMQTSAHVNFLAGETAFRFTYRVDGQPLWKSAITPFKGSNTKSFAVALDTRS